MNIANGHPHPGRELPMLKYLMRLCRRPATIEVDNPLAIRDLLDHPALRALLIEPDETSDTTPSQGWADIAASGPIRFEQVAYDDLAA